MAGELAGGGDDLLEFLAALVVVLLPVDGGKEEEGEAVAVHVAAGLAGPGGVDEESVGLGPGYAGVVPVGFFHEPPGAAEDVLLVLAVADGAALTQQGHAAEGRHGDGVLAVLVPVAVLLLLLGQPLQALVHAGPVFQRDLLGAGGAGRGEGHGQAAQRHGGAPCRVHGDRLLGVKGSSGWAR